MMQKISLQILRLGLAVTFLWIGILIFQNPAAWSSFIQPWAVKILPFDLKLVMLSTAILDMIVGLLFLVRPLVWLAGLLAGLHLISVLIVSGINVITVRDIGLLAAALAVFFTSFPFAKWKKTNKLYKCPECGFEYEDKQWAEKCEAWCKEHKSCNLEIVEHAIKKGR